MQRFHLSATLGGPLEVRENEHVHQVSRVMRSEIGDRVVLFDGERAEEWIYEIVGIRRDAVSYAAIEARPGRAEPRRRVRIVQAVPNTLEKLEYAIQKGVEMGIAEFVIVRTDRSQKPLPPENKRERLRKIAIEATEQCGGCVVPAIAYVERLDDALSDVGDAYVLDMDGIPARDIPADKPLTLCVGPEGGWSDRERERFAKSGIRTVSFGTRVLRTETAAVAAGALFAL